MVSLCLCAFVRWCVCESPESMLSDPILVAFVVILMRTSCECTLNECLLILHEAIGPAYTDNNEVFMLSLNNVR